MYLQKRVQRIVSGRKRRDIQIRRLYGEIDSGARMQQRLQGISEKRFFDKGFGSKSLVNEAQKMLRSRKQRIEMRRYAQRLARKRKLMLKFFERFGLKEKHFGIPMAVTPNGVFVEKILKEISGHNTKSHVEMTIFPEFIAFSIGEELFSEITGSTMPRTKKLTFALFLPSNNSMPDLMIAPNLKTIEKYYEHEKSHAIASELPLVHELSDSKKAALNKKTLEKTFVRTDLKSGAKCLGRRLVDEMIANMVDGDGIDFFEEHYKTRYLADFSRQSLGPKTAKAFMQNSKGLKARLLKDSENAIKAVKSALNASVIDGQGSRINVVSKEELAGLLTNIRDMNLIPIRLPVLIELRKKLMQRKGMK